MTSLIYFQAMKSKEIIKEEITAIKENTAMREEQLLSR